MENTEAQSMARKIRNHERYNKDAAVGELYVQMLRDGGDMAFMLEGSEVDNSPDGEYNETNGFDSFHEKTGESEYFSDVVRNGVGARSITEYEVMNPLTGEMIEFVDGSRPVYPPDHLLAGNGSKKPIRKIDFLVDTYGGMPSEWKHEKAFFRAYDNYGEECNVELHWFESADGIKRELYAKVRNGEVFFYDDP